MDWYGSGRREVDPVEGTVLWNRAGRGLGEVRRVFVRDATGTQRDRYANATDMPLSAEEIVGPAICRWNVERTFQAMGSHMDLETARGGARGRCFGRSRARSVCRV